MIREHWAELDTLTQVIDLNESMAKMVYQFKTHAFNFPFSSMLKLLRLLLLLLEVAASALDVFQLVIPSKRYAW